MKRFDTYGKVPEDLRTRHCFGGFLTIICVVIIIVLSIAEFAFYLQREVVPQLLVDRERSSKIPVHFDITFPYSSCPITSVDILTKSGESMIGIEQNVTKIRIHHDGSLVTENEMKAIQSKLSIETPDPKECRSCYGAETPEKKCCFTCDDVKEAYKKRGWRLDLNIVSQCQNHEKIQMAKLTKDEGCRLIGDFLLNKIGGNFHIAPGSSEQLWGRHSHNLEWTGKTQIDLSHKWNELSFGENSKKFTTEKKDTQMNSMFQYYLTIIPIKNNFINGTSTFYDYSIQENIRSGEGEGQPGVFIYYDVSPMVLEVTESNHGFLHFLIGICSIVGGIFTTFQLFDAIVFESIHTLKKKVELGKDV
ncbi:hypothetical protein conserved [Entamoeba histolytica]|uniref:Endoplasmic reticulum-Golgi intermediate compartment protein 3 n=3 Tax=Entamoeba histolytica TaxID=5759 RepID=C4LV74_ENTH1|nr:hypothetical protein, conserved [Entamoeba histolytica HM-1:IMSS]EAL49587.1 hypothetical protein, conserved [Entamoeba histolytica HM-1:IMSS]BAN38037.1 hypothetical protein, conserved [Entamoeba histolytica]BAN39873.1 hypothetical protein, conserved [Entamoeba histolytica]GAT92559.1 hypothetical protein conserved [Entamoeba histolytica]|eukprot:XP_654976.1 hypothetical protein, conserved [Entamoeba histolytica HM-1:IMSS]